MFEVPEVFNLKLPLSIICSPLNAKKLKDKYPKRNIEPSIHCCNKWSYWVRGDKPLIHIQMSDMSLWISNVDENGWTLGTLRKVRCKKV